MNKKSVICCFLAEHKTEDWERILKETYAVQMKRSGTYGIFNYSMDSDFSDPLVQEARGIILDLELLEVVCWPFRKFGNYNESYADEIDWKTARVQEKVDGSIIKLWYDRRAGQWQFSTNGMIAAADAAAETGLTFADLIGRADNYGQLNFDALDSELTYIFELVSPQTQVVVLYERIHLYHIGTRNNRSGEEYDLDIGIEKPAHYPLKSLEDCIQAAQELNSQSGKESGKESGKGPGAPVEQEGFVVVDENWNRVKIKSPEYLVFHRMSGAQRLTKLQILTMLRESDCDMEEICMHFPRQAHLFKYYAFRLAELAYRADLTADYARRVYEEYSCDRKLTAGVLLERPLSGIGFAALSCDTPGRELLKRMTVKKIAELIPEYEEPEWFR